MARVLAAAVQALIAGADSVGYDAAIAVATTLVDDNLLGKGLSTAALTNIELYLAGHFALLSTENGPLAKKAIESAQEGYHNVYKGGFLSTRFGQTACVMDTTGTLSEMSDRAENPQRRSAEFFVVTSTRTPTTW